MFVVAWIFLVPIFYFFLIYGDNQSIDRVMKFQLMNMTATYIFMVILMYVFGKFVFKKLVAEDAIKQSQLLITIIAAIICGALPSFELLQAIFLGKKMAFCSTSTPDKYSLLLNSMCRYYSSVVPTLLINTAIFAGLIATLALMYSSKKDQ